MSELVYRSYGKINLYLDVLDRRSDGFTNIETVLQSIDLWDRIILSPAPAGITLTCSNAALGGGPDNLVYRAAALMQAESGVDSGIRIHLEKNLPIAAGLAGGSGNAAATLIALNEFWDLGWPHDKIVALALTLGSDVPFCSTGGTVAATGRGEVMEVLAPLPPQWLVLVHPPLAITAGHAYGHPQLTRNLELPVEGRTPAFRRAIDHLATGDPAGVIFNRMESGIFHEYPQLAAIKASLVESGCTAAAMSGSGPTVFGLCANEAAAHGVAECITKYPTSVVQTVGHGVRRT